MKETSFMFSDAILFLTAVAEKPPGRVFGLDAQAFISTGIMLFNACVLAAALSFILYKPVRNFMRKRTERFAAQVNQAEEQSANAGLLKAHYEEKLKDIESERIEVLDEARKVAADERNKILDDAKKDIAALKERAAAGIEAEREQLKDEMGAYVLDASLAIAGKFVSLSMDKETQNRMFKETLTELEDSGWLN